MFDVFRANQVSVDMVATSEVSISLSLDPKKCWDDGEVRWCGAGALVRASHDGSRRVVGVGAVTACVPLSGLRLARDITPLSHTPHGRLARSSTAWCTSWRRWRRWVRETMTHPQSVG